MNLMTLLRNVFAARTALDAWKVVRATFNHFDWRESPDTFHRARVILRWPEASSEESALSFDVSAPIEWHWRPDVDGELPEWMASYTVLDARSVAQRVEGALQLRQLDVEHAAQSASAPGPEPEPFPLSALTTPAQKAGVEVRLRTQTTYTRPELTEAHQAEAAQLALKFTNGKSMKDIRLSVVALLCENQRLTLEVNDHRAARGFSALPTFETNGRD